MEMSRTNYVCTVCSEHFTRKYSANRHNFNIHGGRSEIVLYIEYMVGRSSFRPEPFLQSYPAALPNSQTATVQQKLEELKILAAKFSFPQDASKILKWATIRLRNGDEGFLNDKLEQFRMLDRQGWLPI